MNFDFITDNIAVGTTPETAEDLKFLLDAGVTHLINCRDDHDDAELLKDSGIAYLWNPTPDWTPQAALGLEPKPVEWFKKSLDFWMHPRITTSKKARLFVHCTMGVNRSVTTVWMLIRALAIYGRDCDFIIDSRRPIATFGTFFDHPWREDAKAALKQLGEI